MLDNWPKALIEDLARRRVIIVIGAGVSKNSVSNDGTQRPPLWKEFLESALDHAGNIGTRHIKFAIKLNDFLHACEWLKKKIDDDWIVFLREKFSDPAYKPSDLHDRIFRLDQRVVFSMNIDIIYENFVLTETGGKIIVKKYYDDDVHKFLRDNSDYVIKVHGSIDTPDNLIFSQAEYALARTKYVTFY